MGDRRHGTVDRRGRAGDRGVVDHRCARHRPHPTSHKPPDHERGAVALLMLMGGGLTMLIALVLIVSVADLVVSRGQAQLAADAAALAAMAEPVASPLSVAVSGHREGDRAAAALLARANGGVLLACCGDVPGRREVEVAVVPRSALLRLVLPHVHARAAAALAAADGLAGVIEGPGGVGAAAEEGAVGGAGQRVWPVAGPVSSGFGMRVHPVTGTSRLHAGLDVAVPTGTPIRAAAAGRVMRVGVMGGYGNTVDVVHAGDVVTRYAHQSRVLVTPGQMVAAGQVIGLVGATGTATGPHLHFEVRVSGGAIDPQAWLAAARP